MSLPFTRSQLELMDQVFAKASMGKKLGLSEEQRETCARIAMVFEAYASKKQIDEAAANQSKVAKTSRVRKTAKRKTGGEKYINIPTVPAKSRGTVPTKNSSDTKQRKPTRSR